MVSPCWPHLHRRPPNTSGSLGSASCGVTAPLLWVLVHAKFCLCPPRLEPLFPSVLWKAYNQVLLALKARFPGDSQSLCCVPDWESCHGVQNIHSSVRMSLVVLFSSLWVTHPVGMKFDFIVIAPLLPSRCSFFFVFGCGVFFWWVPGSSCHGCPTASCNFGAFAGGHEGKPFYSAILKQKPWSVSCIYF